jgi:predicted nucleic acid-binding protein
MATAPAYFDTSALLKRYVREDGSAQVQALLRRHRVLSSALAPVEATSALRRRRGAGQLTVADLVTLLAAIREDRDSWDLIEVSALVLRRAEELIELEAVTTLDAIHLASATVFEAAHGARLIFVTADTRQREAARHLALHVEWVA